MQEFAIPWQNIWTGIGLVACYFYLNKLEFFKVIHNKDFFMAYLIIVLFISIGFSRFFNILLYPNLYKESLFELIKNGGLTFYGGMIAFFILITLSAKIIFKINTKDFIFNIIPIVILYHAFARIGCQFAGCCYGLPIDCLKFIKIYSHRHHHLYPFEFDFFLFFQRKYFAN